MKLLVGLGNPGWRYRKTRHNLGFNVIDGLAKNYNIRMRQRKHRALLGNGLIACQLTILAKPMTFMNRSGDATSEIVAEYQIPLPGLLVICDDMNLPIGKLRIRRRGSPGGHNGLTSICEALATDEFPRLRIGIGRDPDLDAHTYVLSRFKRSEREPVAQAELAAQQAACLWVEKGIEACMSAHN